MLVGLKEILQMAEAGGYAVPAFNVYNMETVMGVAEAAEERRAPVILQIYPRLIKEEAGYYLSPVVLAAAAKATVPVCFHLDHGPSELETTRALRYGATGIMLDASAEPFEKNAALTRRVVETAAYAGVTVEGELGHVGTVKDDHMDEFTEPEAAARFVQETGVAALAVLVGTAHGRYAKPPKLDIPRIQAIREAAQIPLVLHGGSGIPDEQIRAAIRAGVRKINFATDICYAFLDRVRDMLDLPERIVAVDNFMKEPIAAVRQFALDKIDLTGAGGHE